MNRFSTFTIIGLIGLVAMISSGCGEEELGAQEEAAIAVKGQVLRSSDQALVSSYTGTLEGQQQAVMYARISEAVDAIKVREGERIKKDQVLLTLDKFGAGSEYQRLKSLYENSEKQYRKMKYLYEEGAISESQYDAAETEYEVNKAAYESYLKLVEIQTPIAGVVTEMAVSEGDLLAVGEKVATVATTEKLRIKFGVNPDDIRFFEKGTPVRVLADAVADTAEGEVVSVASSADPLTRTFQVEALVDNAAGNFKPGMFARVEYVRQRLDNAITVPRRSIVTVDNEPTVFVLAGERARRQPIQVGPDLVGSTVVESGLNPGDTVITVGQEYLSDSSLVNITEIVEQ